MKTRSEEIISFALYYQLEDATVFLGSIGLSRARPVESDDIKILRSASAQIASGELGDVGSQGGDQVAIMVDAVPIFIVSIVLPGKLDDIAVIGVALLFTSNQVAGSVRLYSC
ncbi:MAG: hypothetical protein FVQ83_11585 [Chloroflexi bacterium]|nr:hypothetical protein [Chloroflexota bacterium]